jgi:hypothetical protein
MIKPRIVTWGGTVACREEMRYAYEILDGNPQRKRLFGRHQCELKSKIKWIFSD